jgi:Deoxyribonuclease II
MSACCCTKPSSNTHWWVTQTVAHDHSKWVITGLGANRAAGRPLILLDETTGPSAPSLKRGMVRRLQQDVSTGAEDVTGNEGDADAVKVVCFGDINRGGGQLYRGGGTLCFQDNPALWAAFNAIVTEVADCAEL